MAAKNTVNIQRMGMASNELAGINTAMLKQIKTLEETMASVRKVWTGEAANTYLKQYEKNEKSFQAMAKAIKSASEALDAACTTYEKADSSAMDVVQKLGKR